MKSLIRWVAYVPDAQRRGRHKPQRLAKADFHINVFKQKFNSVYQRCFIEIEEKNKSLKCALIPVFAMGESSFTGVIIYVGLKKNRCLSRPF